MSVITFDTETRGFDWFDENQRAFLATWADRDNEYVADLSDPDQVQRFVNALESASALGAHNLKFDVHQVRATIGFDVMANGFTLYDTDLLSRIMYPEGQRKGSRGGHGLKNLATIHLRADADEPERVIKELAKSLGYRSTKNQPDAYYNIWRAYPEQLEHYAKMDARFTWDLLDKFRREITETDARIFALEQQVQPILARAEEVGVLLDPDVVKKLYEEYGDRAGALHRELVETLGEDAIGASEWDPDEDDWLDEGEEPDAELVNKTEALRQALLEHGVPLHERTKTGLLATNKFALQAFKREFPIIETLFEYRKVTKFLSTYFEPMLDREVVHTNFNQCGAWTSRMSSRRPNMQNIPKRAGKEVRSMFVPREGHSFVVVDYDSIEARLLAYYLGPRGKSYADMIEEDYDVHAWMATHIYGGAYEEYLKGTDGQPQRDIAKNTTYAICYGAGAKRTADMNDMPYDDAKAMNSKIKNSIPGFNHLKRRIRRKVERVGYVNTFFGRRLPVNPEKSYVGLNALIQGTAADIMKYGLVNTNEAVAPLGGTPLLVVHDEVVVEVPTENADEAFTRTVAALESAAPDLYPHLKATGGVVHTNYADA